MKRRLFTLAELTVAMVVLMLIVYMLFRVIHGAQLAWQGSRAVSEMHESAGLALDVISRDLRAMRTSDIDGALVNYAPTGGGAIANMKFAFVSSTDLGTDDTDVSMLSEVGYSFDSATSTLYRWRSTSSSGGSWDFYNAASPTWANSWEDSTILATGVSAVDITAYTAVSTTAAEGSDTTILPSFVNVKLTVHDQRKAGTNATLISKSKLSFSKTIYLNRSE